MDKRASRYAQIASIANAEPIGSLLFYTHLGLLLLAALGAYLFFNRLEFIAAYSVYAILLTIEKKISRGAADTGNETMYAVVLSVLFLRAVAFNIIVVLTWRLDGDVFKMAALALLVSATINIMVFHATFRPVMACVVLPIAASFVAITAIIFFDEGRSLEALSALGVFLCIAPYFGLALFAANDQWQELRSTKNALERGYKFDAIGQVASGVAHDFNNVLGVVSGNLHLLERELDPNERAALVKSANEAVESGASLSRQLLTMGKQQALMPEALSLNAVTDTFVAFCRNVFPASIRVDVRHGAKSPIVYADANLLQSALLNLALNAKAAMDNNGTLTISYGFEKPQSKLRRQGPSQNAFITVSDTGKGMSEEVARQSLEPFYTTRSADGGSGLGLPMVKGFVEQSNGRIDLNSVEGVGTTVTLYLPIDTNQNKGTRQIEARVSMEDRNEDTVVILLIEDNHEMRRILRRLLERLGYDVVAFATGDDAASYLSRGQSVRLVLCDFDLPGKLQGDDLLDLVKTKHSETHFILMSGFAPAEKFADVAKLSQADLFLSKPLKLGDLQVQIEGLLDKGSIH